MINGSAGADILVGGKGHHTYVVNYVDYEEIEHFNEGIGTVPSSMSYTLSSGNSSANTLDGDSGADSMATGTGNNTYLDSRLVQE